MPGCGRFHHGDGVRFTAGSISAYLGILLEEFDSIGTVFVGHAPGGNLSPAFVRKNPDCTEGPSFWTRCGAPAL